MSDTTISAPIGDVTLTVDTAIALASMDKDTAYPFIIGGRCYFIVSPEFIRERCGDGGKIES